MDGPIFVGVLGGVLGAGVVAGGFWYLLRWRRRRRQQQQQQRALDKPAPPPSRLSYTSGDQSDGFDPNVSQNYQHYPIELGQGAPAKPHHVVIRGGRQEMFVTERPQETGVTERPQELVSGSGPQELPTGR